MRRHVPNREPSGGRPWRAALGPALLAGLLAAGCLGPSPARQRFSRAVEMMSLGDTGVAVEHARLALEEDPDDLELRWMYQDLLLAAGRPGDAVEESLSWGRQRQADAGMHLLIQRLRPPGVEKEDALRRMLAIGRHTGWVRLALAEAALRRGDPAEAERWFHERGEVPDGLVAASVHLESALAARRYEEAEGLAAEILAGPQGPPGPSAAGIYAHLALGLPKRATEVGRRVLPGDVRPSVYRARGIAALRSREFPAALRDLEKCELLRGRSLPSDLMMLAYEGAVRAAIEEGRIERAHGVVEDGLRRFPDAGRLLGLHALTLSQVGSPVEAAAEMERAIALDPLSSDLLRQARLFFLERGRPVAAYRIWQGGVPEGLEISDDNRMAPRFRRVLERAEAVERAPADARASLALAAALADAGWLAESATEFRRARRLGADTAEVRSGLAEVQRFRRVLQRVQAYLDGTSPAGDWLEGVLVRIAEIVEEETGDRLVRAGLVEEADFFGKESSLFVRPRSELHRYFLRFNHFLDVKQVGEQTECRISEIVGWRDMTEEVFGKEYRWARVTTDRSPVQHPSEGAWRVAGSASWSGKGLTVDLETIRGTLGAPTAAPTPRRGGRGLRYSGEMRRRLLEGALERAGSWRALLAAEEENVAQHELGHIVDFSGLVPWSRHPIRHMGIFLGALFSAEVISARYQLVAEAFAIARSPDPRLGLLASLDWIRGPEDRPDYQHLLFSTESHGRRAYSHAARELLDEVTGAVRSRPGEHPDVDRERPVLQQLDRLDPEALRRIAWDIYERAGGRR